MLLKNHARVLVALLIVAACGLFVAAPASAWKANDFESPSGNIVCRYFPQARTVACGLLNTGRTVWLDGRVGSAGWAKNGWVYKFAGGRVLLYGAKWTAPGIVCASTPAGLRCRSTKSGHGFFLSRERTRFF